ncbi:lipopolysaccharide biosynthesis protein [Microbacterium sp. JZ101]
MTAASNEEPDDLRGKVARSVGWVVAERWGSRLLQLGVIAVLTRFVSPDDFGLISMATSITLVLQVVVDSGFAKALIQLDKLAAKDASTAFWTSLGVASVVYAALYFASPLLATAMGEHELTSILRAMGLSLPIWALSQTPSALLEREFQFRTLSIRQLVAAIAGAAAAIPVALLGGGAWALVTQTLTGAAVACMVLWASTAWRPRFEYSRDSLRRIWPVGLSIMGTELLDALQGNVDKIAVGFFFNSEILGFYYLAQRVIQILMELVTTVIARVSLTTFSRVQNDLPRLNRIFGQLTLVAGIVGIPIFALVSALGPQIIPLVFGRGWEQSIPILWGLSIGSSLTAIMYFDRPALLSRGRAKAAFWLAALQNVVGILLLFVLMPLGIWGVIISRWARVFVWPVRLLVLHREIGLRIGTYLLQILRPVLAIAPIVVGIALLQGTSWAEAPWPFVSFALPVGLVGLVLYGAIVWMIAGDENRSAMRPFVDGAMRKLRFGRR